MRLETGKSAMFSMFETSSKNPESGAEKTPVRRWRWGKYVLLGLLLAIVLAEAGLRVLSDRDSKFNVRIGAGREWDPYRQIRLKPNYSYGTVSTNSRGFLGPEFNDEKPAGGFRIVVLGDSCTFMPPDHTYSSVLQRELQNKFSDRPIEVINAGTPGYDSRRARIWYERDIDPIPHDLVLIYIGWNDMGQYNPDGLEYKLEEESYLAKPNWLQWIAINSYLIRSTYLIRGYWERGKEVSLEPMSQDVARRYEAFYPEHYEKNLKSVIELAVSRGRQVRLLNFVGLVRENPTPEELKRMHFPRNMGKQLARYVALKAAYDKALEKVSRDTGTPIIDIASDFTTAASRKPIFDSVHFDGAGSEVIGKRLAREIAPLVDGGRTGE